MEKKLMLWISDVNKISMLQTYGTVTFVDDYSGTVFLLVDVNQDISAIRKLPFVQDVQVSRTGELLMN